jgi:hypothetical protein
MRTQLFRNAPEPWTSSKLGPLPPCSKAMEAPSDVVTRNNGAGSSARARKTGLANEQSAALPMVRNFRRSIKAPSDHRPHQNTDSHSRDVRNIPALDIDLFLYLGPPQKRNGAEFNCAPRLTNRASGPFPGALKRSFPRINAGASTTNPWVFLLSRRPEAAADTKSFEHCNRYTGNRPVQRPGERRCQHRQQIGLALLS